MSKHFENILFVIGCVVIKIVKLIVRSNYISLSNKFVVSCYLVSLNIAK